MICSLSGYLEFKERYEAKLVRKIEQKYVKILKVLKSKLLSFGFYNLLTNFS